MKRSIHPPSFHRSVVDICIEILKLWNFHSLYSNFIWATFLCQHCRQASDRRLSSLEVNLVLKAHFLCQLKETFQFCRRIFSSRFSFPWTYSKFMTWQTGDLRSCGIIQRFNGLSYFFKRTFAVMCVNLYQNMPRQASCLLMPVTRSSNHIEFTFRICSVAEDRKSSNIVAICKPLSVL